jgi:hypothetical protein
VRHRRPEQRDDGITNELLYGAAEALELRAGALVIRGEQSTDVFRVELLRAT